jgi:hypothetical protein
MTAALSLAIKLADEIEAFPLGRCGPSDDPDKQYAYVAGFRDVAVRFLAAVKRIGDPSLSDLIADLDSSPEGIVEAHELRAGLFTVVDALRAATEDPNYSANVASNSAFLNVEVLLKLKAIKRAQLDPAKLIKMCEELNDAYARGNYISCALLLRAVMNHVPPAFGASTFPEVVAQSGRSVKAILSRLNEDARPVADLHTHLLMRATEHLPTRNQLEPYKAGFEILVQEILGKLSGLND